MLKLLLSTHLPLTWQAVAAEKAHKFWDTQPVPKLGALWPLPGCRFL